MTPEMKTAQETFQKQLTLAYRVLLAVRTRREATALYESLKADLGFSDDDFAEAAGRVKGMGEEPIRVIASSEGGVICGVRANHPVHFSSLDQDELEEEPEENSAFHQNYVETQKLDEEYEELPEAVF